MKVSAVNLLVAAAVAGVAASACSSDATPRADSVAAKPAVTTYVGYGYDPVPEGVSLVSASEIMTADGQPTHFVLTHAVTPLGNTMWLDSLLPTDGQLRRRIVRAELIIKVENGNRLIISTCDLNKKLDPAVVAIVRDSADANGKYSDVVRAWRANPRGAKFDTLSGAGIICEEPNAR